MEIPPDAWQALNTLGDGRNIVTTNILREKLELRAGDTLMLKFDNGPVDYRVTGFLDTNYGIGYVGFIASENYKANMGVKDYSKLLIRIAGKLDTVKSNIQRSLATLRRPTTAYCYCPRPDQPAKGDIRR